MHRPKRIGLNLLYFRADKTGGGETYAKGLLGGLQRASSDFEFVAFVTRSAAPALASLESIRFHVLGLDSPRGRTARHLWEQMNFARICREHEIDLLHSLGNVSPLRLGGCRSAVTIHDLLYRHAPSLSLSRRWFYSFMIPRSTKACDAVLAVSQSTYNDLRAALNVPEEKLFLVPEGPGQDFADGSDWESTKIKYSLPDKYFLTVGTARHKRVDISLQAVQMLRQKDVAAHLVVAGEDMESTQKFNGHPELTWLGYVPDNELADLYRNATAVICSSEMEGFGLPVLEAMALGTPVISTDRGALSEVVGNGGMLVECGDAVSLASAMLKLQKPNTREEMVERGREQASSFSWDACARATIAAYQSVLGEGGLKNHG